MLIEFALQLFPDDGHFRWRFDAQANATTGNTNHGHRDMIPDQDPFANLTTQYKHSRWEHTRGLPLQHTFFASSPSSWIR